MTGKKKQWTLDRLRAAEEHERLYAVDEALAAGEPSWGGALAGRLAEEKSPAVRDALVFALQRLESAGAYPTLFTLFASSDASLRNSAVAVFGSYRREAVRYLSGRYADAPVDARKLILDALSRTGLPDALPVVRQALLDPDVNVRIAAIEYAGVLQDRKSIPQLRELFRGSAEPMLRTAVLDALSDLDAWTDLLALREEARPHSTLEQLYLPALFAALGHTGRVDELARQAGSLAEPARFGRELLEALSAAEAARPGCTLREDFRDLFIRLVDREALSGEDLVGALAFLARFPDEPSRRCLQSLAERASRAGDAELAELVRGLLEEPSEGAHG